jgi:transcriptional regulator with XRE-family HTH domain
MVWAFLGRRGALQVPLNHSLIVKHKKVRPVDLPQWYTGRTTHTRRCPVTAPSNEAVGQLLGVSHATVSRYKSGDRLPTIDIMGKIAEVLNWSMDDQYAARQSGNYAREFIARLPDSTPVGAVGKAAAEDQ